MDGTVALKDLHVELLGEVGRLVPPRSLSLIIVSLCCRVYFEPLRLAAPSDSSSGRRGAAERGPIGRQIAPQIVSNFLPRTRPRRIDDIVKFKNLPESVKSSFHLTTTNKVDVVVVVPLVPAA